MFLVETFNITHFPERLFAMKNFTKILRNRGSRRPNISFTLQLFTILDYFLQRWNEHIKIISKFPPMNSSKLTLSLAMLLLVAVGCQNTTDTATAEQVDISRDQETVTTPKEQVAKFVYDRQRNGKIKNAEKLPSLFTTTPTDSLDFPAISKNTILALQSQLKALEKRRSKKNQRIAGLDVSIDRLKETIEILINYAGTPDKLKAKLTAHQAWGKDKKGHVKFTGYYAPIVRVKKKKDELYKYPFYSRPENWNGSLPTREQIDSENALAGRGLEIAYASNPVDIYYMQLQGSGYIKFVETGEKMLLRYDGSNGKKYRSIETYLARRDDLKITNLSNDGVKNFLRKNSHIRQEVLNYNPSYAFFKISNAEVTGAGGVPLTKDISIAADPNYFPIGSVALASIPVYNKNNKISHHEFKILLPQDVGGAVKGAGHVDIYSGIGTRGKISAMQRHHYGQMWLLLPKENEPLALN